VEASRPATETDLPRIVELARAAEDELRPMRGGEVWAAQRCAGQPLEERLADGLTRDDRLLLAGTLDDVVVGYASVRLEALPDDRVLGVVDDLFVEHEARAVGLGEAMMAEIVEWCRGRRCMGIDAIALPGHRATKNFFEESGMSARLLVMHRSL